MKGSDRLKKLIHEADVIVEVVDARDVPGTRLPEAERMSGTSRLLIVANKADLLSEGSEPKLPRNSILMSAKTDRDQNRKTLAKAILAKSQKKPAKALFIGYPNVGKSSLINMLARRKAARVSAIAGTTKNEQWVRAYDNLMVTDYRGIFPKGETREALARKGAINIQRDARLHAGRFADQALSNKRLRGYLEKRFDIDLSGALTSDDVLEAIAIRRNLYIKGGELNTDEAARILIRAMMDAPEA